MKDLILTTKIAVYSYSELTAEYKKIVDAAKEATKRSYSPYSKFCVGAALQLDNGEILTGANQENAAFTKGDFVKNPVSPCGHCRQAILEYETISGAPIEIVLCGRDEVYVLHSIKDLMPLSFCEF